MKTIRHFHGGARQRGLAMVEMAITLPLLLFLLVGTTELGRAFYQYTALTKAVRDGARYAAEAVVDNTGKIDLALATENGSSITQNVQSLVVYGTTAGGAPPLLPGLVPGNVVLSAVDAVHVRVVANYTFQSMFGGTIPSFGVGGGDLQSPVTLTASATMRGL
ncbi:MAG: TadE family protein [Pseudomonadota bacterium]|nr:TadE family protein [Pseudomonadota bacterium]